MKKIIILALIGIGAFFGFKLIKSKQQENQNAQIAYIHTYKPLEEPKANKTHESIHLMATLEAKESLEVATKISGYIQNLYVKENQPLTKGQKLLHIDDTELRHTITQLEHSLSAQKSAKASLESSLLSLELDSKYAQNEHKINQKLYAIGGISKQKLDLSLVALEQKKAKEQSTLLSIKAKQSEIDSTQALLESKKSLLPYYTLHSAIDGFVDVIISHEGELATASKPIIKLLSKEQQLVASFANEQIKANQEVYMEGKKIGHIAYINKATTNFLQSATIILDKPLEKSVGSLVDIEVQIK